MALSQDELFGRFASYLLTCFDAGEIRRLLSYLPDGTAMARNLPSSEVSAAAIARAAVTALYENDYLNGKAGLAFWDSFKRSRPRRLAEIDQWQAAFRIPTPVGILPDNASGGTTGDPSLPEKLEILLVSASPIQGRRLAVDIEFREIVAKLRHRSNLRIVQRTAVTFDGLQSALNDHTPQVLHISCHSESGYLHFEPNRPGAAAQRIHKEALAQTLDALDPHLRLVILNACDSLAIAERLVGVKDPAAEWAIGMSDEILDQDAINFSAAFYDTIAAGRSLEAAFKQGKARLLADSPDPEDPSTAAPQKIPHLVPSDSARAKKTFLVAPPARASIE